MGMAHTILIFRSLFKERWLVCYILYHGIHSNIFTKSYFFQDNVINFSADDQLIINLPKMLKKYNLNELFMLSLTIGDNFVSKFMPHLKNILKNGRIHITVIDIVPSVDLKKYQRYQFR